MTYPQPQNRLDIFLPPRKDTPAAQISIFCTENIHFLTPESQNFPGSSRRERAAPRLAGRWDIAWPRGCTRPRGSTRATTTCPPEMRFLSLQHLGANISWVGGTVTPTEYTPIRSDPNKQTLLHAVGNLKHSGEGGKESVQSVLRLGIGKIHL